jgi:TPP-dependent trihydroxycyclohexane-1,2-dione (THcHDO) dehydratase
MMKRDACLKVLARHRTDEIGVAVYQAAQEWLHISPSDLNYTFTGAMGQGSSHALGIALGRPDKRVVVLDGDGSLLMNLGTLVTIARAAPRNLVHCLCQNGTYETNGAVNIPGRGRVSFPGLAREAGYPKRIRLITWTSGTAPWTVSYRKTARSSSISTSSQENTTRRISDACTTSSTASVFAAP